MWTVYNGLKVEYKVSLGHKLPSLEFSTNQGDIIRLDDYRGKNVLALFVAPQCAKCVEQLERLENLPSELEKENWEVLIIATSLSPWEPIPRLTTKESESVLYDTNRHLYKHLGGISIPAFFVIDTEGIMRHKMTGLQDIHDINDWLRY